MRSCIAGTCATVFKKAGGIAASFGAKRHRCESGHLRTEGREELPKMAERGDPGCKPAGSRGMSVHVLSGIRRFVLAVVAIGIPVLWAFGPYAYRVGEMQYMTFGSITLRAPVWVPL
jgi:hypothetical protein